ncbi:MAG: ADP-ribosylglycohydrolase family protein [Pseudomonadota bacterium]
MKQNIKDAVMASFVADALALGVHWVYDIAAIKNKYGRLEQMVVPEPAPYHKTKTKGQFTHYGDQALVLLESVVEQSGFDPGHFSKKWQAMFADYTGYVDGATKETLKNLSLDPDMNPSGSMSSDLGGAARIASLALFYGDDPDAFVAAAKTQTAMTHNQSSVIDSARFFALASTMVLMEKNHLLPLKRVWKR